MPTLENGGLNVWFSQYASCDIIHVTIDNRETADLVSHVQFAHTRHPHGIETVRLGTADGRSVSLLVNRVRVSVRALQDNHNGAPPSYDVGTPEFDALIERMFPKPNPEMMGRCDIVIQPHAITIQRILSATDHDGPHTRVFTLILDRA